MRKVGVYVVGMVGVFLFVVSGSILADVIQWEEIHTSGEDGINTSVWTKDVDNRAGGANGGLYAGSSALYFCNGKRDYSHLERSVDGSKLAWVIGSVWSWEEVYEWEPGIAVYWDENNWVRLYPRAVSSNPHIYNCFYFYGKINGVSFAKSQKIDPNGDGKGDDPVFQKWYSLKLVFTDTQIKCEYADGKADNNPADTRIDDGTWYELDNLVIERPDSMKGQNAIFIYGKGADGSNPDLDNNYSSNTGASNYIRGYHTVAAYVPEPATIGLLAISALGLLRKR